MRRSSCKEGGDPPGLQQMTLVERATRKSSQALSAKESPCVGAVPPNALAQGGSQIDDANAGKAIIEY